MFSLLSVKIGNTVYRDTNIRARLPGLRLGEKGRVPGTVFAVSENFRRRERAHGSRYTTYWGWRNGKGQQ